ncbi:hypothetical protein [Nostoc sp. MG11]|uniref:hypothetical protein n=1 Tax=Nostoc sp. MG11 TaxID=2721166 RepID=UPI001866330C|nr:hypothetical protein [Nostoc sp. MG11]
MPDLYLRIEIFYRKLQAGDFDHPADLAKALEALADQAWDEIDELYQPSLRIP